jgi:3-oxoacyl-[acyl-carrier protein] reductase
LGKDGKGHQVFKFSPDGKVLMTLGKAGVAGDDPHEFNVPSAVLVAPNGDVFVADGHGGNTNARIVKFSPEGNFIRTWGKKGSAPGEWRDQVALVTGGARGIGRATARLLAKCGATVCVNYAAHADAAEELAAEIMATGGHAIVAMADVAEAAAAEAIVARAERELGPLTILVNNAGVSWQGTLDTYDSEQVTRLRRVNVEGLIHATRAVIGGMRARRYGRIVNVASIARIGTALPGTTFYAAHRGGSIRGRALEVAGCGLELQPKRGRSAVGPARPQGDRGDSLERTGYRPPEGRE